MVWRECCKPVSGVGVVIITETITKVRLPLIFLLRWAHNALPGGLVPKESLMRCKEHN